MINNADLSELLNSNSIEELWDMHTRRMAAYGFDRLIYGYTRYRSGSSLGDPEDFVLLTNHSSDYTEGYFGEGLYHHAPMIHWALENEGACSWTVLADMETGGTLTKQEMRVVDFNRQHNVTAGYSVSFKSVSPRTKGGVSLSAKVGLTQDDADAIWAEHGDDIVVWNNITHLKIITLPYSTPSRALTKRQREVLGWVGDGKTIQDIATIMALTPATVEKHLRLARDALSVETTAQAVLKAAFQNQIFVVDV